MGAIKTAAERLPETKFVMVEPMQRPAVEWYTDGLEDFTKMHNESLFALQLANISIIKRFDLPSQMFADDYVHLTQSAGIQFLRAIIYFAEKIYEAQVVDLESEVVRMDEDSGAVAVGPVVVASTSTENASTSTLIVREDSSGTVTARTSTIQEQIDDIVRDTQQRRHNDSMVTARIREEMDHLINTKTQKKKTNLLLLGWNPEVRCPLTRSKAKNGWMSW